MRLHHLVSASMLDDESRERLLATQGGSNAGGASTGAVE